MGYTIDSIYMGYTTDYQYIWDIMILWLPLFADADKIWEFIQMQHRNTTKA